MSKHIFWISSYPKSGNTLVRAIVTSLFFSKDGRFNLKQLKQIIGLKFDTVLFDNMSPKFLKEGVKISKKYYQTEASGGITLKNIKKIAKTGVNRISVGAITHSAPILDLKLHL